MNSRTRYSIAVLLIACLTADLLAPVGGCSSPFPGVRQSRITSSEFCPFGLLFRSEALTLPDVFFRDPVVAEPAIQTYRLIGSPSHLARQTVETIIGINAHLTLGASLDTSAAISELESLLHNPPDRWGPRVRQSLIHWFERLSHEPDNPAVRGEVRRGLYRALEQNGMTNPITLVPARNREAMAPIAALMVYRAIERNLNEKGSCTLLMPADRTSVGTYQELIRLLESHPLDLSNVRFFFLDNYENVPEDYRSSDFRAHAERVLIHPLEALPEKVRKQLRFNIENVHTLGYTTSNPEEYEGLIARYGGIDFALLGIGENSHIGFNEPPAPFNSKTHVADVKSRTRKQNKEFFGGKSGNVPKNALTVGVGTILGAREIVQLGAGPAKANGFRRALDGSISEWAPTSALRLHGNVTIIADDAGRALLHPERHPRAYQISRQPQIDALLHMLQDGKFKHLSETEPVDGLDHRRLELFDGLRVVVFDEDHQGDPLYANLVETLSRYAGRIEIIDIDAPEIETQKRLREAQPHIVISPRYNEKADRLIDWTARVRRAGIGCLYYRHPATRIPDAVNPINPNPNLTVGIPEEGMKHVGDAIDAHESQRRTPYRKAVEALMRADAHLAKILGLIPEKESESPYHKNLVYMRMNPDGRFEYSSQPKRLVVSETKPEGDDILWIPRGATIIVNDPHPDDLPINYGIPIRYLLEQGVHIVNVVHGTGRNGVIVTEYLRMKAASLVGSGAGEFPTVEAAIEHLRSTTRIPEAQAAGNLLAEGTPGTVKVIPLDLDIAPEAKIDVVERDRIRRERIRAIYEPYMREFLENPKHSGAPWPIFIDHPHDIHYWHRDVAAYDLDVLKELAEEYGAIDIYAYPGTWNGDEDFYVQTMTNQPVHVLADGVQKVVHEAMGWAKQGYAYTLWEICSQFPFGHPRFGLPAPEDVEKWGGKFAERFKAGVHRYHSLEDIFQQEPFLDAWAQHIQQWSLTAPEEAPVLHMDLRYGDGSVHSWVYPLPTGWVEELPAVQKYLSAWIRSTGPVVGLQNVSLFIEGEVPRVVDITQILADVKHQTESWPLFGKLSNPIKPIVWSTQPLSNTLVAEAIGPDLPKETGLQGTSLGIDVGGSSIKFILLYNGRIMATNEFVYTADPKKSVANAIQEKMFVWASQYGISLTEHPIVCDVPGPVLNGRILELVNLEKSKPGTIDGLSHLQEELATLGIHIQFANDGNAAAYFQVVANQLPRIEWLIVNVLGTGVAMDIFHNGVPIEGALAEFHMTQVLARDAFQCGCGLLGCSEPLANTAFVVREAERLAPEFNLNTLWAPEENADRIRATVVGQWLSRGADPHRQLAQQVFHNLGRNLMHSYRIMGGIFGTIKLDVLWAGGLAVYAPLILEGLRDEQKLYPEFALNVHMGQIDSQDSSSAINSALEGIATLWHSAAGSAAMGLNPGRLQRAA